MPIFIYGMGVRNSMIDEGMPKKYKCKQCDVFTTFRCKECKEPLCAVHYDSESGRCWECKAEMRLM